MSDQQSIGARDLVAFLCELAMLALLVAAGHGMAHGWRGWALGVFLAFVAIGIWVQWMAPRSARRLPNPTRFVVQIMLFLTVGLYAAAGGLPWWGIGFAVIAIAVFGALARVGP
jgi:hypothetical protein